MTGRRIVSIWLPVFPMDRWQRKAAATCAPPDDRPLVLAADGPHGPVVHAANRGARLAGVQTAARVVDMQALLPALRVEPADPPGDRAALVRLALWARRWCPWSVAEDDGLMLDTTGSDHLWGGEAALLAEIEARLSVSGFAARPAAAPTRGAAWALARFGPVRAICRDVAEILPLPVAALRLDGETVLLLHRLGLKTVGDLTALPRLSLARRFVGAAPGEDPLLRLDQAMGRLAEPLAPSEPPPLLRADARLAEPILDPGPHLPALCADLCRQLAQAGQGVRRLALTVYRTDGEVRSIMAAIAAPSRDPSHLAGLFRDRLERIDPGFGFDLISLDALVVEPLAAAQVGLAAGGTETALALAQLADRLTARFGPRSLLRSETRASHVPERAEAQVPLLTAPPESVPAPRLLAGIGAGIERPVRLFDPAEEVRVLYTVPEGPPVQFLWRRQNHRIVRYQGPERIAPEWWHDRPGTRLRDYFKVEDQNGCRLWLYRDGLHGDGRGGEPRWFLQGLFV